jgi:HEAT repeat protein
MGITLALAVCLQEWAEFRKLAADPDPEARIRAIEKVRDLKDPKAILPFLGDDHPRVRARAVRAAGALGDADSLVRLGLRHPRPLVRQGACEALGAAKVKSAAAALIERLDDPDAGVRAAACAALAEMGEAADRIAEAFRRHRDWPTRTAALEALKGGDLLPAAISDPSYQVRLVAAELRPTAELMDDRDWRVRAAAIEACLNLRERACIGWLIDRLAGEKGRLKWDAYVALVDLTGNDLGLEAKSWRPWWEANRETFQVKPRGKKGKPAPPEDGLTKASFFKVPILSNRIVFVLDLSGSMREPSPDKATTKLDAAKRGMIETIRSLDADTRFGILGLGSDEDGAYALREKKTWHGRLALLPASPELKADAERFVSKLEAKGWTNLYDALELAMSDPDVDTIFVYSDGGASRGVFYSNGEVLEHLARFNRFRKIVLHTVEVPGERNPEDNRRLLARLAEESGGTCRLHEKKKE